MKKLLEVLSKTGFDGFLLMIAAMILLAYFLPRPGLVKEPVSLEQIANAGVLLIFLFYGGRLSVDKLKAGLANWKMHIVVQLTTFVFSAHRFSIPPLVHWHWFRAALAGGIFSGSFTLHSFLFGSNGFHRQGQHSSSDYRPGDGPKKRSLI